MDRRIPIYSACGYMVARVSLEHARIIAAAPNATAVYQRKTRGLVQVNLTEAGDDYALRSQGTVSSVYHEAMESSAEGLAVLSISTGDSLRRWGKKDQFNPRRFNPDSILESAIGRHRGSV